MLFVHPAQIGDVREGQYRIRIVSAAQERHLQFISVSFSALPRYVLVLHRFVSNRTSTKYPTVMSALCCCGGVCSGGEVATPAATFSTGISRCVVSRSSRVKRELRAVAIQVSSSRFRYYRLCSTYNTYGAS